MRTNYMYGRVKRTLLQEIFALTLCLWIKAGSGPGLGTPFSYSAPGQSNELVLIEWGNNPMELLVDDKVRTKVRTKNFVNQVLLQGILFLIISHFICPLLMASLV